MSLPLRRKGLNTETPFFFSCKQCLSCCRHKRIQVNPYEVTRLAANLGLSTDAFIERYTHNSGTVLNWEDGGTCVFLDSKGCSVRPDRPLVCRLYPLGRHVLPSGEESFSEIEPDQECKGVYGQGGTITDYLGSQYAYPFMKAADNYLNLLWRLYLMLEKQATKPKKQSAIVNVFQRFSGGEGNGDIGFADVDSIVAAFCEKLSIPLPDNIDEKMSIHIRAVEAWANNSRRRRKHEVKKAKTTATKGLGKKHHKASH